MPEFQKGMSLLAFGEKTGVAPYRVSYPFFFAASGNNNTNWH